MTLTAVGSFELPHLKFPFDLVQAEVLATDGAGHSGNTPICALLNKRKSGSVQVRGKGTDRSRRLQKASVAYSSSKAPSI